MPTFNVLIATVGRPTLQRMLDSLKPQLEEHDCLTAVFDGHATPPSFNYDGFKCKIVIHCEPNALGYWGHAIRNKYAPLLEKRDFVMHADDDDSYNPNSFNQLRGLCTDLGGWYIAKMNHYGTPVPRDHSIWCGNIGTPCGIVSYELNKRGTWTYVVGGDCKFYLSLQEITKPVFLEFIIYTVRG